MASREPKPSGAGSSEWTTSPPLSAASAPHTPCRHEPTNLAPHAVVPTTANNPLKAHCLMHTYGERSVPPQGQALDRHIDVGVVKDDEWRVAARFERQLLDRAGALLHQQFAGLGRAGEGQFA